MSVFQTSRYNIQVNEKTEGGPGGYESTYLNAEGDAANVSLYNVIYTMSGRLLPAESYAIRQRNGSQLIAALEEKKPVGIASGFKPSGAYHFGHTLTSGTVAFFQKNGAQVFVPVADVECEMDTKITREEYLYWAADNLIDWGANGVNLDAAHVYLQSEEKRVSDIAYLVARGLTFDLAVDTYGFNKMVEEFPFLFAGLTQVGDILLPQHKELGNFHSFMVSGQDQDGHMKMTVELSKRAFERKADFLGIQTIPSGLYIPHIRGIVGKASSSKPENTLYLGSGPLREDLDHRIISSLSKLDGAIAKPELRGNIEKVALDMVRYIEFFNNTSRVNFREELSNMLPRVKETIDEADEREKSHILDEYLLERCKELKQDNITLVRDTLKGALTEHQQRREGVMKYAVARANYQELGAWSAEGRDTTEQEPEFWKVPNTARVNSGLRNKTRWFDIVSMMKDKLII